MRSAAASDGSDLQGECIRTRIRGHAFEDRDAFSDAEKIRQAKRVDAGLNQSVARSHPVAVGIERRRAAPRHEERRRPAVVQRLRIRRVAVRLLRSCGRVVRRDAHRENAAALPECGRVGRETGQTGRERVGIGVVRGKRVARRCSRREGLRSAGDRDRSGGDFWQAGTAGLTVRRPHGRVRIR